MYTEKTIVDAGIAKAVSLNAGTGRQANWSNAMKWAAVAAPLWASMLDEGKITFDEIGAILLRVGLRQRLAGIGYAKRVVSRMA